MRPEALRRFGPLAVSPVAGWASCCIARCGLGLLLFAVPGFRAVRSCLVGPGCLVCRAAWCAGLLVSSVVPLCTDQSCPPATNVARNSPEHISDCDIRPLELQRLWAISKNDRVKLRAKLIWSSPRFPRGHRGLARAHRRSLHRWRWGFCTIRSLPSACRRRVAPLMVQFPPFGGGEVAT